MVSLHVRRQMLYEPAAQVECVIDRAAAFSEVHHHHQRSRQVCLRLCHSALEIHAFGKIRSDRARQRASGPVRVRIVYPFLRQPARSALYVQEIVRI